MSKHRKSGGRSVRVFISYGREDSFKLAMRLKAELGSRGYDVWLDRTKIRAGRAWEQQIIEGLRKTQVVIALLSPHSTRWNDSDTGDSVCLDELAWARYEPPPTPIVPVLAEAGANIPLTIYRLYRFRRCPII
jgi:TIR domain